MFLKIKTYRLIFEMNPNAARISYQLFKYEVPEIIKELLGTVN